MAPTAQPIPVQGNTYAGQGVNQSAAPILIAGSDGTNARNVLTDSNGNLRQVGAVPVGQSLSGIAPVAIGGNDGSGAQMLKVDSRGNAFVNTEGQKATYSASVSSFTPVASPTDFFNIFGSASKTIRITRIEISASTTSATPAALDLSLNKRSTAGTAGSAVLTNLTGVPHDSTNAAVSAVASTVGTANYTTLGTLVGVVQARKLVATLTPLTATDFPITRPLVFDFTNRNEQGIVLRGITEQLALGFGGASLPAGLSLDINITWTEE